LLGIAKLRFYDINHPIVKGRCSVSSEHAGTKQGDKE
jgi:hypothetical protein